MDAVVFALDPRAGARAGDRLAGLSLVMRAVLEARAQGSARVWVVLPPDARATFDAVATDARARALVLHLVLALNLAAASAELHALPEVVCCADAGSGCDVRVSGLLARAHAERGAAPAGVFATRAGKVVGRAVVTAAWLRRATAHGHGLVTLEALLARHAERDATTNRQALSSRGDAPSGALAPLDIGASWSANLGTPAGRRDATRELFEACRKPVDGLVSRHLNRRVSLFVSRRLCALPVTPNTLSILTFALCLPAAALAAQGGYGPVLAGAALMQLNSILDGVDGELARVRYQQSRLGQWLDTVLDDGSNLVFYAGLGWGARGLPGGDFLFAAAWVAIAASALTALQYYAELARLGSGDFYALAWQAPPPGWRGAVVRVMRLVLKQDFFIFLFLCLALFGALPYALPAVALGALVTLGAATARAFNARGSSRR